jgi:energy-coupling factor transporter ATP-binding protein EcfA2
VEFEPDNYSGDTAAKFKYMVEQLKSDTPNGRIMIFRGEPGGGKTYLIRSLVGAVERATFVVVPAAMVGELDGPNLVGTLINTYSNADGPIVLILEDADSVLAPRGADNMHSISSSAEPVGRHPGKPDGLAYHRDHQRPQGGAGPGSHP